MLALGVEALDRGSGTKRYSSSLGMAIGNSGGLVPAATGWRV